jgi:sorbitol-specific phosphotransferase system component IIC
MSAATQVGPLPNITTSDSKTWIWVGRIVPTLVVLFCAFDGLMKVIKEPHVIAASAQFGFSPSEMVLIGVLMLACTVLYAIPRTAILGAVLLTGYLGGAVLANIHVGHPLFECIFPVIFGALAWGGIFVREARLRELIPFRK